MADQHYYTSQQHQQRPFTQNLYSSTPTTRQAVKFLTASTIGTILLLLSGLTLTATVISLIVTTPLLVLFSPILIPAIITALMIASGFMFSGGCGVVAFSALSWIYQYVTGKHPPGSGQLDHARSRIGTAARDAKENLGYGGSGQDGGGRVSYQAS